MNNIEKQILIKEYEHHVKMTDEAIKFSINLFKYITIVSISGIVSLLITHELKEDFWYYTLIGLILLFSFIGFFSIVHIIYALFAQLKLMYIESKLEIKNGLYTEELTANNQRDDFWITISSKFFGNTFRNYWFFSAFIVIIVFGIINGLLITWLVKKIWDVEWVIRAIIFIPLVIILYGILMRFVVIFQLKLFPPNIQNIIKKFKNISLINE
jgi:hypothetical protein